MNNRHWYLHQLGVAEYTFNPRTALFKPHKSTCSIYVVSDEYEKHKALIDELLSIASINQDDYIVVSPEHFIATSFSEPFFAISFGFMIDESNSTIENHKSTVINTITIDELMNSPKEKLHFYCELIKHADHFIS